MIYEKPISAVDEDIRFAPDSWEGPVDNGFQQGND